MLTSLELFKPTQKAPNGPPEKVVWKFRFEYCNGSQPPPWWSTPIQRSVQQEETSISTTETLESQLPVGSSWDFIGPSNTNMADTIRSPVMVDEPNGHVEIYRSEEDKKYTHQCENCRKISHKVYADGDICLNESCSWFFGDASDASSTLIICLSMPMLVSTNSCVRPDRADSKRTGTTSRHTTYSPRTAQSRFSSSRTKHSYVKGRTRKCRTRVLDRVRV